MKTNDPLATRRLGNRPKPDPVRTVDPKKNVGAAVLAARKQNVSDGKSYPKGRNVIENSNDDSILTHDRGGEE
jgi:hypothetical protein